MRTAASRWSAVTGVNGKTTTTRLIAHILRGDGPLVGMTTTDGLYIGARRIDPRDCAGPQSARAVLLHPRVEAAVLETARGGILREGLGFDRCHVGVVTNIGQGDHLGLRGIDTLEDLARVKRCVVEAVSRGGHAVLNADDPLVAGMAERCRGAVIWFARDPAQPDGRRPSRRGRPGGGGARRRHRVGRGRVGDAAAAPGAGTHDRGRSDRLPGPERPGRDRRGLGPGAAAGIRSARVSRPSSPTRTIARVAGIVFPVGAAPWSSTMPTTPRPSRPWWRPGPPARRSAHGGVHLLRPGRSVGDRGRARSSAMPSTGCPGRRFGCRDRAAGELPWPAQARDGRGRRVSTIDQCADELTAVAAALDALGAGELLVIGTEAIGPCLDLVRRSRRWRVGWSCK